MLNTSHSRRVSRLAAMLAVAAVLGAIADACGPSAADRQPRGSANGGSITLAVEPFALLDTGPHARQLSAFAESLSVRLAHMPGLHVRAADDGAHGRPEFTLGGDIAMREGRLVIAMRLSGAGEAREIWTATFWRSAHVGDNLAQDIAADVSEKLYPEIVRRLEPTRRERQ